MYPRPFDYVAATSVDEAVSALAGAEFAKVLAGGMSLLPLMKMRLFSPDLLVDIGRIPGLDAIEDRGDHVAIGALVRHRQTAASEALPAALRAAAAYTGDAQVRNQGTTCGSVSPTSPATSSSADTPRGAGCGSTSSGSTAAGNRWTWTRSAPTARSAGR